MESEAGSEGRGSSGRQRKAEDLRLQREVLALVIVEQPVTLTEDEIVLRTVGPEPPVRAAIEELVGCGLLRREQDQVLPTPAALRLNQLEPIEPPTDV